MEKTIAMVRKNEEMEVTLNIKSIQQPREKECNNTNAKEQLGTYVEVV